VSVLAVDANVWVSAFDPHNHFHGASAGFLAAALEQGLSFTGPAFVLVEVACALARRGGDTRTGHAARDELLANPRLALEPLTSAFLSAAARLGADLRLGSGDALYAAAAELTRAPLVSWDDELIRRAGGATPATWLEENSAAQPAARTS